MIDFTEYLNEQLKDPELKAEWDALEPEFNIKMAIYAAQNEQGITQDELVKKADLKQNEIKTLQSLEPNPTLSTLQKLASAMDMRLKLEFVPIANE